jgi:dTMP kinase
MDRYAVCQYASLRARAAAPAAERRARLAYRLFPRPDVTFLLSVDPQVAHDRVETRGYDHESIDYLASAAAAYRSLPEYAGFVVIDANGTPDEVAAAIRARLPLGAEPDVRNRARALLVAGGSVATAVGALGYQVTETF